MTRSQSPPLLSHIRGARNYQEQLAALRSLKDEIVGHDQYKEEWVGYGVIKVIVRILQTTRSATRPSSKESRGQAGQSRALSEDEVLRLQALQLLASFASGGPAFLSPLHGCGVIPVILSNISPLENPPQVILTALRALSNIADAASLAAPGSNDSTILADTLFAPRYLDSLYAILTSDSTATVVQEQKGLVARLISRLCKEAHHQNTLANGGILDALATILASFVVQRGEVVPEAAVVGQSDGLAEIIPSPAPRRANLALVLEAISVIIADSRFRACMLLCSPAIMAVFPSVELSPLGKEMKSASTALEMSGLSILGSKRTGAMDHLLPIVPTSQPKSLASHFAQFPPLGYSLSREQLFSNGKPSISRAFWDPARQESASSDGDADTDDPESPLIPWLIHLVRSTADAERAMAASVVASLFKAGFANPEREAALGMLVIPLLCQLLKEHDKEREASATDSPFVEPDTALGWAVLERTPTVIARLVADSEYLQQSAFDCGVVKLVCKLLKDSYEPLSARSAPRPWSPNPDSGGEQSEGVSSCRTGPPGVLPIYTHKIKMRESALKLMAAMITFKEEYRKAMVEQDIVPYIVESLYRSPRKPRSSKEKPKEGPGAEGNDADHVDHDSPYGTNPSTVIIAACHVIRILGRSVSNLRTRLEDHGVAMPVFRLLKHPDAEVQIAACGAVCNLILEYSPMREPLIKEGIVKVLCEHAHSLSPRLRLNSMWALKHVVIGAGNDLKKQCLDELEPGWLVQLICDDTEDDALHARMKLERQAPDADEDDEDMEIEPRETEAPEDLSGRTWLWPPMYRISSSSTGNWLPSVRRESPRMQRAEKKLIALRGAELNPTRKARVDDLAIQEQGLCFIGNLIVPPASAVGSSVSQEIQDMTEMVDYVFLNLGQDRLFEILASKLRVKVLHPFARRRYPSSAGDDSSSSSSRVLYPQTKVVEAVVRILSHLAASIPRHRQLVIAQTELLRLLGGHFNSKDMEVRRLLCHLMANLVCVDDSSDAQGRVQRAQELKKMGFLSKLETLEQMDAELDVRERAKDAAWQMKAGYS
ncbi:armadillo-type protein [Diplogelasinospora grovesii]|uniref:Armadillo-type protein n=1 Tax=Diplogelasinospora grovesii TaxID=303347 RepID=A0AAN6NM26_9PEZI|nr:armadillo-type protein [Diplogelasinospora grovesii]